MIYSTLRRRKAWLASLTMCVTTHCLRAKINVAPKIPGNQKMVKRVTKKSSARFTMMEKTRAANWICKSLYGVTELERRLLSRRTDQKFTLSRSFWSRASSRTRTKLA